MHKVYKPETGKFMMFLPKLKPHYKYIYMSEFRLFIPSVFILKLLTTHSPFYIFKTRLSL